MSWKDLFETIKPIAKQVLSDAAEQLIPECDECGAKALPIRCLGCGNFSCLEHSFVNPFTQETICLDCASTLEGGRKPKRRKKKATSGKAKQPSGDRDYPWSVLGVKPSASETEINKAFRIKAAKLHPDHGGNQADFQKLNEAKEIAIKIVRGG